MTTTNGLWLVMLYKENRYIELNIQVPDCHLFHSGEGEPNGDNHVRRVDDTERQAARPREGPGSNLFSQLTQGNRWAPTGSYKPFLRTPPPVT